MPIALALLNWLKGSIALLLPNPSVTLAKITGDPCFANPVKALLQNIVARLEALNNKRYDIAVKTNILSSAVRLPYMSLNIPTNTAPTSCNIAYVASICPIVFQSAPLLRAVSTTCGTTIPTAKLSMNIMKSNTDLWKASMVPECSHC
eukprot:m.120520 g.120520  ORF g.120520 m.120520 type:complete len:148 (+) comp28808_c1_seq3:1069-1512(+)